MRKIIFIGGIHGVGKSTFCQKVSRILDVQHFSASTLINMENRVSNDNISAVNIQRNQKLLLTALDKLPPEDVYLIDGHYCLINSRGIIHKIPLSVFENINPKVIITLTDKCDRIAIRLKKKEDIILNEDFIPDFQKSEISYSEEVAESLGASYLCASIYENEQEVITFIKNFLLDPSISEK